MLTAALASHSNCTALLFFRTWVFWQTLPFHSSFHYCWWAWPLFVCLYEQRLVSFVQPIPSMVSKVNICAERYERHLSGKRQPSGGWRTRSPRRATTCHAQLFSYILYRLKEALVRCLLRSAPLRPRSERVHVFVCLQVPNTLWRTSREPCSNSSRPPRTPASPWRNQRIRISALITVIHYRFIFTLGISETERVLGHLLDVLEVHTWMV